MLIGEIVNKRVLLRQSMSYAYKLSTRRKQTMQHWRRWTPTRLRGTLGSRRCFEAVFRVIYVGRAMKVVLTVAYGARHSTGSPHTTFDRCSAGIIPGRCQRLRSACSAQVSGTGICPLSSAVALVPRGIRSKYSSLPCYVHQAHAQVAL